MEHYLLAISGIIIFFLVLIYFINIKNENNKRKTILEEKNFFKTKCEELEKEKNSLLKEQIIIAKKAFEEGIRFNENNNRITIKIDTIENETGSDFWVYNNKKYEFGYKYTICINGIETIYSSTQILKQIKKTQIDKDNIKQLLSGIQQIENLRNINFIISDSIKIFKDKLVDKLKK